MAFVTLLVTSTSAAPAKAPLQTAAKVKAETAKASKVPAKKTAKKKTSSAAKTTKANASKLGEVRRIDPVTGEDLGPAELPDEAQSGAPNFDNIFTYVDDKTRNTPPENPIPIAKTAKLEPDEGLELLLSGRTAIAGLNVPFAITTGLTSFFLSPPSDAQCVLLPSPNFQYTGRGNGVCVAPPSPDPELAAEGYKPISQNVWYLPTWWRDPELNGDLIVFVATNKPSLISNVRVQHPDGRLVAGTKALLSPNTTAELFWVRVPHDSGLWNIVWDGEPGSLASVRPIDTKSVPPPPSWNTAITEFQQGVVDGEILWASYVKTEFGNRCSFFFTGALPKNPNPLCQGAPNSGSGGTNLIHISRSASVGSSAGSRTKLVYQLGLKANVTSVKVRLTSPKATAKGDLLPETLAGARRSAIFVIKDQIGPFWFDAFDAAGALVWSVEAPGTTPS